ncbi:MAG TPA: redoxin domain-containing protein [Thermoanaerobaculia bacterium]|jgi:peroxiredoxin|nr:redoxin domain-containing protein [Thermoanaerobaculia bacterium]
MRPARRAAALLLLTGTASALEIGETVPSFTGMTVQGSSFSLADAQKGHRAIVVMFRSTLCPYSNSYNELLKNMTAEYGRKRVLFLAVHSDRWETDDDIRAHGRKYGHTFPVIRDPDGRLAALLNARRTPEVFVMDGDGKLRYHGRIASKLGTPDLRNALDALLAGRRIERAETKAFGCSIDRS